jgi:diadenylate cyclase
MQNFLGLLIGTFSQIQVQDVIDILFVTIVLYKIISFIADTKALQISVGFISLIIISFLVQKSNLKVINFLLFQSFQIWVILFIVLFQTELRNAFAKFGDNRLLDFFKPKPSYNIHDIIIKSVMRMSRKNIGALIVIERNVGLKNYIETGTLINSDVSIELLTTIFFPNTPLHDGAVIIKGQKVIAAGCILPLSDNFELKKELKKENYGTRHRAALGLSEETDALIICLSEETGSISVALKGNIISKITEKDLEEFLSMYAGN